MPSTPLENLLVVDVLSHPARLLCCDCNDWVNGFTGDDRLLPLYGFLLFSLLIVFLLQKCPVPFIPCVVQVLCHQAVVGSQPVLLNILEKTQSFLLFGAHHSSSFSTAFWKRQTWKGEWHICCVRSYKMIQAGHCVRVGSQSAGILQQQYCPAFILQGQSLCGGKKWSQIASAVVEPNKILLFFPRCDVRPVFKGSDGCQGAYCPLNLPKLTDTYTHTHIHSHTPLHEQVRQYANTHGTCSLDAFTLQSLTPLSASQDVGCSFSQLCLHICFSGCNRVSVSMKRVGVVKKKTFIFCSCNMWQAQRWEHCSPGISSTDQMRQSY